MKYSEKFSKLDTTFEMFTKAGDNAMRRATLKIIKKIEGKTRVTAQEVEQLAKAALMKVAEKHSECYDSEPPYHMEYYINKALEAVGYGFEVDSDRFYK